MLKQRIGWIRLWRQIHEVLNFQGIVASLLIPMICAVLQPVEKALVVHHVGVVVQALVLVQGLPQGVEGRPLGCSQGQILGRKPGLRHAETSLGAKESGLLNGHVDVRVSFEEAKVAHTSLASGMGQAMVNEVVLMIGSQNLRSDSYFRQCLLNAVNSGVYFEFSAEL